MSRAKIKLGGFQDVKEKALSSTRGIPSTIRMYPYICLNFKLSVMHIPLTTFLEM